MDLGAQLERYGMSVSGVPPETMVQIAGESVPVLVQQGQGDLVECVVALGDGGSVSDADAEQVAVAAPGDTAIERVDDGLRIARHLALPTPSDLYDAVHEIAKCAVALARTESGAMGSNPTFDKASTLESGVEAPVEPAPAPEPVPAAAASLDETVAAPAVTSPGQPLYWFYVDAPQPIVSGDASRTVLATLQPGTWYQALEDSGDWVRAADDAGVEGWLGTNVVRRQ